VALELLDSCKLWIVSVDGERRAVQRAPRRGTRIKVQVEKQALAQGHVFLLCRKGTGDIIVAASAHEARLDPVRERLGAEYLVETAQIDP
jgi:hypothetical protein